jgi:uncharacterized protein (TIGR03790 family)
VKLPHLLVGVLLTSVLASCQAESTASAKAETPEPVVHGRQHGAASRVMVVVNQNSPESKQIGAYYKAARGIPERNMLSISCPAEEEVTMEGFERDILGPIKRALAGRTPRIDYIVTTRGVPIRVSNRNGLSVDALIAAHELPFEPIGEPPQQEMLVRARNPFFNSSEKFDGARMKMRLVTRLDGYTVDDVKGLIDRSIAAKPAKGVFFFDMAGNRQEGGYGQHNQLLSEAHRVLTGRGFESRLDSGPEFVLPSEPLMGYAGWGSNDAAFSLEKYRAIKFLPGSIAETYVSTSGRTFRPTSGGQSLIADLVRQGVTGVKGYVSEPYLFAMAVPPLLFDRYVSGWNLAESYYCASPVLKWKDVIIGDPLCAPYSSAASQQAEQ